MKDIILPNRCKKLKCTECGEYAREQLVKSFAERCSLLKPYIPTQYEAYCCLKGSEDEVTKKQVNKMAESRGFVAWMTCYHALGCTNQAGPHFALWGILTKHPSKWQKDGDDWVRVRQPDDVHAATKQQADNWYKALCTKRGKTDYTVSGLFRDTKAVKVGDIPDMRPDEHGNIVQGFNTIIKRGEVVEVLGPATKPVIEWQVRNSPILLRRLRRLASSSGNRMGELRTDASEASQESR